MTRAKLKTKPFDLDAQCTQDEFAAIVGLSKTAVSLMLKDGKIAHGQTAREWTIAYCARLRANAAGRGADGDLAAERAKLIAVQRQREELKLARDLGESIDSIALAQVLALLGSLIASKLEPIPARAKVACPELSADALRAIEIEVTEARNIAAAACVELLTTLTEDMTDEEEEQAEAEHE